MSQYELTNNQRKYFGLFPVDKSWERQPLSDTITVYYDGDKIVKILNCGYGWSARHANNWTSIMVPRIFPVEIRR
jgi:hypothetical protein